MGQVTRPSTQLRYELAGASRAGETAEPCALVVDDDPDMTRLVTAALGTRGVSCIAAYDATQGFMLAKRRHPKILLLDWHMPGGGGPGLLKQLTLSTHTKDIPVVVVTNDTSPEVDKMAAEHGAKAVLRKPIDPMAFLDLVTQLVR